MDSLTRGFYRNLDTRSCHTLLALKGILLVAAILLISSSNEISRTKPCELEKELDSLSVDYTTPCKYDDIKKESTTLCNLGISFLVLNVLFFLLILNFLWIPKSKTIYIIALVGFLIVLGVAIGYSIKMLQYYNQVLESKETNSDTNYAVIKSSMISQLKASYTSDNVTGGGTISNSWNKFFIKYECCAINQVQGTTNDFDSTPWCTTSGSCQSTASHIEECQISRLLIFLLIIGTLEIAESLIALMSLYIICWIRNNIRPESEKIDTIMEIKGKDNLTA